MPTSPLLKVSAVSKNGETGFILDNISFSQRRLQKIAVAGETGSGKSTLLKIIAGLVQSDTGEVRFLGEVVTGPTDNLVPGYPGISYLSQDFGLPRFLRVEQILDYANDIGAEQASVLYKVCRISHLLKRNTDQLSGGERQRIAVARLLIASPKLLLLDEPFSNLDRMHKVVLKMVIEDIVRTLKISVILISHDPEDILSWADKIMILKEGRMIQAGTPEKIYEYPVDAYVAGLFGRFTIIDSADNVFSKFFPAKTKAITRIVRPEQFKIIAGKKNTVQGKVIRVVYYGSYCEAEVECGEKIMIVRTVPGQVGDGDIINVSYPTGRD